MSFDAPFQLSSIHDTSLVGSLHTELNRWQDPLSNCPMRPMTTVRTWSPMYVECCRKGSGNDYGLGSKDHRSLGDTYQYLWVVLLLQINDTSTSRITIGTTAQYTPIHIFAHRDRPHYQDHFPIPTFVPTLYVNHNPLFLSIGHVLRIYVASLMGGIHRKG
ncbi:uncharacterized protein LACBIDRAFT_328916 [Laccaria bicolor S238N-H82]|uniref:Predicted protein n=1 Tax=Laccaria bicolor (strain S238N-H82 / ATCC MYA-4686) TaxID=486041 RepID=B0DGE6_LACBS|nr:uncharacterized protein LACBIDRAFT_328916 [Laccaria bicolor S238N-H82]EDR06138.1 predicted protein [Laccaria bicolor S238N-H82]|eukprot:XP_001882999.1 predicted protein [Laccaria bicolor S238N-H82]